ncbi:phosphatase PAP2 family protein [Methylobacterium sp. Leaf117]|uniref:phosphatase PAP2 family protein n=1 Tax=Methylobacterium sp. Leaf117 TaxID=1736260 RepID=UPI000ABD0227|nr:phosphatase PAP2 family protein [Methylobacterium sp. Leaf117]
MSDATPISMPVRGARRWRADVVPVFLAPTRFVRSRLETPVGRINRFAAALAAPHPGLWGLAGAVALLDALWLRRLGIAVAPQGFTVAAGLVGALLALAFLFGPILSEPKLRAMALASACLIAVTLPIAVLHYLTATWALPLADARLARTEVALGFDWPAYLAFLQAHPRLAWWLALAYHTSGPQVGLTVIVLAATCRLGRLWAYVRMFTVLLVAVVLIAALVPAAGPFVQYGLPTDPDGSIETMGALWHLDALEHLRAGTLHTLALGDIRGLVTFPSFHVCLAALTAWALAPVPVVGPLAILLNAVIMVATLGAGGHYLPDLLAGFALSAVVIGGRSILRRRVWSRPRARGAAEPAADGPRCPA